MKIVFFFLLISDEILILKYYCLMVRNITS